MNDQTSAGACLIRLAITDNDPITVAALYAMFSKQDDINVIWSATSGIETMQRCEEDSPEVLLLDMSLSDMPGTDVCRRIRMANASTAILAMTAFPLHHYASDAAAAGAQGIIAKTKFPRLLHAVRQVNDEQTWQSDVGNDEVTFQTPSACHKRLTENHSGTSPLTAGEIQVLNYMVQGLSSKQIARKLQISDATVRTHSMHARLKLGAKTVGEALVTWYASLHR